MIRIDKKTKDEGRDPSDERTEGGTIADKPICCEDGACHWDNSGGCSGRSAEEKGS